MKKNDDYQAEEGDIVIFRRWHDDSLNIGKVVTAAYDEENDVWDYHVNIQDSEVIFEGTQYHTTDKYVYDSIDLSLYWILRQKIIGFFSKFTNKGDHDGY